MPRIGGIDIPDVERPGLGSVFAASARSAAGQVRYGVPYAFEKLAGTASAQDEAEYQAGIAAANAAASKAAPASLDDLTGGRVGFARFVGENLVASLPQMGATLLGGAAGALAGGPGGAVAGAIAAGTPLFVGSNVSRQVEEQGGLSEAGAARAFTAAPVQAASDVLVERFLPGAGKLFGDFAATQTGNFLARTAKAVAKAGATEAVTEAGQQVLERAQAGLEVSGPEATAEYVNAAVTAFAVGGVLGAGGGFRRTPAMTKPLESVTDEDLTAHIDSFLDGSARLTPPTLGEEQTSLPLVGGSAVEVQPALPFQDAPVVETPASQLPQLPMDPGLSTLPPETQLELGQRFTDNLTPVSTTDLGATAISPDLEAALRAMTTPRQPTLADGTSQLALGIANEGGVTAPTVDPATRPVEARLFNDDSLADLTQAIQAKDASPELKAEAQRELDSRRAEAVGAAELTGDFKTRMEELTSGLKGGFVQKLTADNPTELVDKIYTEVFENQNTASNVQKLAQRAGLLDADLNPTERANAIEAQRTAALQAEAAVPSVPTGTPVSTTQEAGATAQTEAVSTTAVEADPSFAPQWEKLKRDAGINRLRSGAEFSTTPANLQQAQAQVFRALATDNSNAAVSQTEKLARKMGLVTDDDAMDITPLGREAYLSSPEGLEDTVAAATQQGYTGAQASIFDRGAKAQVSGETGAAFTSFEDMAAYEAGKVWAQDFIATPGAKTLQQTRAIQARQDARTTGKAVARQDVQRSDLTPAQVQQQSLNRLLDAADLGAVNDTDVAALRRMVRDGATPAEVGAALQEVQGGRTLFRQPAATQSTLTPRSPGRGQPIFKEMNTPPARPTRAQQRAGVEEAVQTYNLRQAILAALTDKEITAARADKLNDLLDEGKVAQVERLLDNGITRAAQSGMSDIEWVQQQRPTFEPIPYYTPQGPQGALDRVDRRETVPEGQMNERDFAKYRNAVRRQKLEQAAEGGFRGDQTLGGADVQLEQFLTGKTFMEAAQHLANHGSSKYQREIMKRVAAMAKAVTAAGGHEFDLKIVKPGDMVPVALTRSNVRAIARITKVPPKATVWLKSVDMGAQHGMNEQLVAHEMLHAVTMSAFEYANTSDPDGKTKLGRAVKDLRDLRSAIVQHFNGRAAAGKLNDFEQAYYQRTNNSLSDIDELVSWGLTNPDMQKYLQSIEYKPRQSVFGRLVELLRNLLGLDGKYDTALTELMRVSEQVLGLDARDLAPVFERNDPAAGDVLELQANAQSGVRTVGESNEVIQGLAAMTERVVEAINPADLGVKARRTALGWISQNQMDRQYGERMPALLDRSDALRQRDAVRGRFASMGDEAYQNFERLEREAPQQAERVGKLMALTTEFRIDPDKAFDAHEHLQGDKNIDALRRLHRDAVKLKNDLSRGDAAGAKMFNEFRARNEAQNYARLATEMHALVALDPELSLGVGGALINPMDTFMTQEGMSTPEAIRDHWQAALQDQLKSASAFVAAKRGEAVGLTGADLRGALQHLSPIEAKIASTHEALAGMARSPYFHLGRFGDNFGSASIRTTADGTVDPVAQTHVANELAKAGFGQAQISTDNTRPKFSMRFETVDQTNRFRDLMVKLQGEGWLGAEEIKAGPRTRADNYGVSDGLPGFVQRYIQSLEASPVFVPDENMTPKERAQLEARKRDAVQIALDTWIEGQPDSSISKVMTARYTVPGYDKDMVRSFAHRFNVGANALANTATSAKLGKAYTDMRAQATEALETSNADDPNIIADVLTEVRKRDAGNPISDTADSFDKLRAVAHGYYLGMSPAYGLINMTQLGVMALPELAKAHGYAKSFHAMRRAGGTAFKLLTAAIAEARSLGPKHWADVTFTENVLKRAGIPANQIEFARHMLATGTIDIGSSARALGQVASGAGDSKLDTALKYASAIGLYTESFSRLTTALAARELHGGTTLESAKYATKVVSNSMFDYQNWNTARQLGKQGFAGPITPLLTQFMSYSVQATEKLYSEVLGAFARARPGESAEATAARRAESRRFILGHLTAVTALAGTLGLPFAAVFARAIEKIADAASDDDEPYDATAAWRNFLASVLGKDVAEVVARGLPRAVGFDVSQRAGEATLLPFSEMITDRRSWREAVQSQAGRSIGAAPDMLLNVADAGTAIGNGDLIGGMKALLPVAFKGPLEAYRMTTDGYVDSRGTKLPMSPNATSVLWQLLGFSPAEKAEYSEARGDQQSRRVGINREAQVLRQGIVRSIVGGDQERARELIVKAQAFDAANPAFAVIPSLAGALQRQQQSAVKARALGTPLGVPLNDLAGQELTGYANVNYR